MNLELKTELFMEIEDYESKHLEKLNHGLDITAMDSGSDDKVLLRVITKPKSKSGYVNVDTVDRMAAVIKNDDYDRGILIGDKFTKAAEKKMEDEGIQRLTENSILDFPLERLYYVAKDLVDDQCKTKCGKVPQKESDCKGHLDGQYSCEIRLMSDNVSFHFQRGWAHLLGRDALQLLSANHATRD